MVDELEGEAGSRHRRKWKYAGCDNGADVGSRDCLAQSANLDAGPVSVKSTLHF